MIIQVEPRLKKQLTDDFKKSATLAKVSLTDEAGVTPHVRIGSRDFLNLDVSCNHQILIVEDSSVSASDLQRFSRESGLSVFAKDQASLIVRQLEKIQIEFDKKNQINLVRADIQKKRKELEELNQKLKSESDQKIEFLEKSHTEETEKNQNEKSLLHFLDFIQSESVSDDFPEKLFRFIWKDLKKYSRLYTIGFNHVLPGGKSKMMTFNGSEELLHATHIDFETLELSKNLATLWGRPVGHILKWKLPESSRPLHLFIEVVDRQHGTEKINQYVSERLAVLSLYLDRWLIEKEIEIVVNRWQNTFKSFSGYTHVIDEDFKIYHSNYGLDQNDFSAEKPRCYRVLAGRDEPCEKCPILNSRNSQLSLKSEHIYKTFYSQFKFENKKYYFVIYEDISKIMSLQTQIIQTEKMSTLGRLGNHLAHELNNPLTGLKSYVQTLLTDEAMMKSLPDTAATDLNEILKASIRCQKIIKNFIDFSQNKEPSLESVNLNEVLQNTLVLLKTALRNHRLFVDVKDRTVKVNSHDLQQVIFNIVKNACQAMEQAGSVKIFDEIKEDKIYLHIQDSGKGFSEIVIKNIFQPFTTTKAPGEGTGLGLYLSKKLMNNMQADLAVSSSDQGAKVTLIFDNP